VYEVSDSKLALEMGSYEYQKTMGAYKPKFEGIPEDYHPLSCCEVVGYVIFVVGVIGGSLGFMIGSLFWVTNHGLEESIQVWSIIFLLFTLFLIIAFYVGGRMRIREEKRLIVEAQHKQEQMANQKNVGKNKK
jgi:nitrate/nitrite transporter NarK